MKETDRVSGSGVAARWSIWMRWWEPSGTSLDVIAGMGSDLGKVGQACGWEADSLGAAGRPRGGGVVGG